MGAEVPKVTQFAPGPWTQKINEWYPDLLDERGMHAACYVGYPEVQDDILGRETPASHRPARLVIACGAAAIAEAA